MHVAGEDREASDFRLFSGIRKIVGEESLSSRRARTKFSLQSRGASRPPIGQKAAVSGGLFQGLSGKKRVHAGIRETRNAY